MAAILLLLPTACVDDAQAPVVDNLGTVLSPSNSLIREPANSSVNGTLKSTYEYLRLIDGHDLPDDDGYAHDHLVAALRPYLVNGGDSRQAHVTQLMAASSLKTLNALSDKERSEVDKRTRLPKGCITRKTVMTDLPIATMRREIGLSNDGLCLTPWKVKTTSSEEARWAMQALDPSGQGGRDDDRVDRKAPWQGKPGVLDRDPRRVRTLPQLHPRRRLRETPRESELVRPRQREIPEQGVLLLAWKCRSPARFRSRSHLLCHGPRHYY